MDVLVVLTALTVFVGVRTGALIRSRRASGGRRAIVHTVLPPRPTVPRADVPRADVPGRSRTHDLVSDRAPAPAPAPAPSAVDGAPGATPPLPTRRSLRRGAADAGREAAEGCEPAAGGGSSVAGGAPPVTQPGAEPTSGPTQLLPPRRSRTLAATGVSGAGQPGGAPRRARRADRLSTGRR